MMHRIDAVCEGNLPDPVIRSIKLLGVYDHWINAVDDEVNESMEDTVRVWEADSQQDFGEFCKEEGLQVSHPVRDEQQGRIWLMSQGDKYRQPESVLYLPESTNTRHAIFAFVELTEYQFKKLQDNIRNIEEIKRLRSVESYKNA